MANDDKLSGLTRSLLLGVSVGTITLTQVGCVPASSPTYQTSPATDAPAIVVRSVDEKNLCTAALKSQSVADVNRFLEIYPDSRCIAPLLNALPIRVLAALSPSIVEGISPSIVRSLPSRVTTSLPGARPPAASSGAVPVRESANRY